MFCQKKNFVVTGDIGCYTLGNAAPLHAMDSCARMGGLSVDAGLARALACTGQTEKRAFGVAGESTFFRSGMTSAVEIAYHQSPVIPVAPDKLLEPNLAAYRAGRAAV